MDGLTWRTRGYPAKKMAEAGLVFCPDAEAKDKTKCVYCGIELAHWNPSDLPAEAHRTLSPGCTFWRKMRHSSPNATSPLMQDRD